MNYSTTKPVKKHKEFSSQCSPIGLQESRSVNRDEIRNEGWWLLHCDATVRTSLCEALKLCGVLLFDVSRLNLIFQEVRNNATIVSTVAFAEI